MLLRFLKKTLVFSVVAVGMVLFVLSCENPFSNSLGRKVPIEPPIIVVESPVSGAYLKGDVQFTGRASAYRELRAVEVKIFNTDDESQPPVLDWTPVQNMPDGVLEGDIREKTWSFTLDSLFYEDFEYIAGQDAYGKDIRKKAVASGKLKMQFRVIDPDFVVEPEKLVYVVKNGPSIIKISMPDTSDLVVNNPDGTTSVNEYPSRTLEPGTEIKGNIIDRRGIKPGYPQIKFWPETLPGGEPADNDTNWGWAVLLLSGIDDYEAGIYTDRTDRKIINVGNFIFRLTKYTIDSQTRRIIYDPSGEPLPTGAYRFRIKTSDTFFDDDVDSPDYMRPRAPDAERGEEEAITDSPEDVNGPAYKVVVATTGVRPNLVLDNTDKNPMPAEPHVYITSQTARKIVVSGDDRTATPAVLKNFRLRLLASHNDLIIQKATLTWEHNATGRSGDLSWDNVYDDANLVSLGYYDPAQEVSGEYNEAVDKGEGHRGAWKNPAGQAEGKFFQFTANNDDVFTYSEKGSSVTGKAFTSSTEPYTLTVTVWPNSGDIATQTYTLYLDGNGPDVSVRSIRGAYSIPEGDASEKERGGTINASSYTVNGNIQVAIDHSANMSIMTVDGAGNQPYPVAKWHVEVIEAGHENDLTPPSGPNSMYQKLQDFRSNPAGSSLAFFDNITGSVVPADENGLFTEDKSVNFKLNVSAWNKKYLWLYVISQDKVYNLGYTVQKLYVDEDTDKPLLKIADLKDTGAIANPEDLYIILNSSAARNNVLDRGQGIELSFSDDDGLRPAAASGISDDLISIELTNHNFPGKTAVISASDLVGRTTVLREWNGILKQDLMAAALKTRLLAGLTTQAQQALLKALYNDGEADYLPDGLYTIEIKVPDAKSQKVSGTGLPAPATVWETSKIHFAVYFQEPRFVFLNPSEDNSTQTKGNKRIYGMVSSRLKIQKLNITFTPDIVSTTPSLGVSPVAALQLYRDVGCTQIITPDGSGNYLNATLTADSNGDYIYYWEKTVNFDPPGLPATTSEKRTFSLQTWDGLGEQGLAERNVQIDATPPVVELIAFNYGRLDYNGNNIVNGKIRIDIDAFDTNGINGTRGEEGGEPPATAQVGIRWYVLPSAAAAPTWNTIPTGNGRRGTFTFGDRIGGGRYRTFLDTTANGLNIPTGDYRLYVIAEDYAENRNDDPPPARLIEFTVNQASDIPEILEMDPPSGDTSVLGGRSALKLTGSIYDDDGFNFTKAGTYVRIRFATAVNSSGVPTAWSSWTPVPAEEQTGYLKYTYDFSDSATRPAYLKNDGLKQYMLWVTDENERGASDGKGNYLPEGKNPDMYDVRGNLTGAAVPNVIGTAQFTGTYSFFLKNTDPEVFFNNNDPNVCHRLGHAYDREHDHISPPADVRPVFSTRAQLLDALNTKPDQTNPPDPLYNLRGTIQDISLSEVSFTYGNQGSAQPLTVANGRLTDKGVIDEKRTYAWTVLNDWLAPFETANTDGMHSINIRAADSIGNFTIAEWSFNKDTTGPEVSFDNISADSLQTIFGDPGEAIYITGQFNDIYSDIGNTFSYKLYKASATAPANFTTSAAGDWTSRDGSSASWRVAIPGTFTDDGPYLFQIRASDARGNQRTIGDNPTTNPPIRFVVDRRDPEMIAAASMRVSGHDLRDENGNLINGALAENKRVFSAATVTNGATGKVFTLSGIVYEHNLNELTAAIRNRTTPIVTIPSLTGIDEWVGAWRNSTAPAAPWYGNGTANDANGINTVNSTFRVRRATTTNGTTTPNDLTNFGVTGTGVTVNYRYVWELDIREGDFYNLLNNIPNGDLDDGATRSITVTARDLARKNSTTEVWQFFLDSTAPEITFLNVDPHTGTPGAYTKITTLEDASITLSGMAEDSTNISRIQYKIEQYNYTTSAWATVGTEWRTYTAAANSPLVTWNITNAAAGNAFNNDGLYRLSVRAADYSLSNTAGGNLSGPTAYQAEFYVDRSDPLITWNSTLGNYYKWNKNSVTPANINELEFNLTVTDNNTLNSTATWILRPFGNSVTTTLSGTVVLTGVNTTSATGKVTLIDPNWNNNNKIPNGRYTLSLTIKDKAGHQASVNQTINFYLDNNKPLISVDPAAAADEAITGRVVFRGSFTKALAGDSPIARVAYAVSLAGAPAVTDAMLSSAINPDGSKPADTALKAGGWYFNNGRTEAGNNNNAQLSSNSIDLMEINQGVAVANLLLYDTRNFNAVRASNTDLLGPSIAAAAPNNPTFNGTPIATITGYDNKNINQLRLHLLAIDEAGNHQVDSFNYWVFPAGDYPRVLAITNPGETDTEVNRQLNGTIRISGTATDNYRVQHIWFRVLKDSYNGQYTDTTVPNGETLAASAVPPVGYEPALNLAIPVWDNFWNATDDSQSPTALNRGGVENFGAGWYKANGGGPGNISWWAQINTDGELDPNLTTSRKIIIQTIAEDTIWVDSLNNGNGDYASTGILSVLRPVTASVVKGAPIFANEEVKSGVAGADWGNILTTAVKGTAGYRVVVKHDSGVGSIRWTNSPSSLVTPTTNILDGAIHGNLSGDGIQAKAGPRTPLTGTMGGVSLSTTKTYMVWTWGSSLSGVGGLPSTHPSPLPDNYQRYTTFKPTSAVANIGTAVVIEQAADGTFEWLVEVDLNTAVLNSGAYATGAAKYQMSLEAHEISKSVPLFARKTAEIPIDNLPPGGMYTHSTNVAGTAPTFGGEAGDETAPVMGLSRVVLWFSRNVNGTETSMVWNRRQAAVNQTFNNGLTANPDFSVDKWVGTKPASVVVPKIPTENNASQNSCIVIDRHDPLGNVTHHGHKQQMGFETTSGDLGTSWYVVLNSMLMESGRVTAHYIVYDRAGNGTYYNQKLMILNGVPRISGITLATDIGTKTADLHTTGALGDDNAKYDETATGAMARIRTAMGVGTTVTVPAGISEEIPIDTTKPGVYSVVYDRPDFMVRNNLLAIKVNTIIQQTDGSKPRNYRVEYVSGARSISGVNLIANSTTASKSGIRAGKVYIINEPGVGFPWGVLGVDKDVKTYQRGTVFLATVDGYEIDLVATTDPAFTNTYGSGTAPNKVAPSVWELNGEYYNGDTALANVLTRTVPEDLWFGTTATTGHDITYPGAGSGTSPSDTGKTAEFVYNTAAFGTTAGSSIRDFNAGASGANLDAVGRPKPYPAVTTTAAQPWYEHSLFIIKIFDGPETDLFGDFALLSIRVNNNDQTPPYSQLYDLNPKTEGETGNYNTPELAQTAALNPGDNMGANRLKGGLWNTTGKASDIDKSGHVEPRTGTSLTSAQMGGATGNGTITRPAAQPFVPANSTTRAYFEVDTVSGDVIVRGYAEDNQRVARVDLEFFDETNATRRSTVTILTQEDEGEGDAVDKSVNGALVVPDAIAAKVNFTETIDLNLHRVEWAYLWSSEDIPGGSYIVGNYNVRAIAFNAHATPRGIKDDTTVPVNENVYTSKRIRRSTIVTPGTEGALTARKAFDSFNVDTPASPGFPASDGNFYRYNDIRVNIRPYITGILRNSASFSHNIRSRQGRYIIARGEAPVIAGFNLRNGTGNTTVTLPGGAGLGTRTLNDDTERDNYVVKPAHRALPYDDVLMTNRYRYVSGATTGLTTGEGLVTLLVNNQPAVNTGAERQKAAGNANRPLAIQPWNKEYSAAKEGSELWDDFIMMHIWRSDENMTAAVDRGRFSRGRFNISYPSMSINPTDGTLWASHQEGGNWPAGVPYSGGGSYISSNNNNATTNTNNVTNRATTNDRLMQVASWSEHMTHTNIFVSGVANGTENFTLWNASSSVTMSHQGDRWTMVGGMWLWGPTGANANTATALAVRPHSTNTALPGDSLISNGPRTTAATNLAATGSATLPPNPSGFVFPNQPSQTGHYAIESLWYNGATTSRSVSTPVSLEQFHNPNIVSSVGTDTYERVHISYYDEKDGSLKYRYNRRGANDLIHHEGSPRRWVNLDGGADVDDNAPIEGRPGSNATNSTNDYPQTDNVSVRVRFDTEPAYNPTTTLAGSSGGTTANWAYTSSTTAQQGTSVLSPAAGTINVVHVQNGSFVRTTDAIYTIGASTEVKPASAGFVVLNYRTPGTTVTTSDPIYRLYPVDDTRIRGGEARLNSRINAGRHNSIDVTGGTTNGGWPVIAYYNETNQGLKIAVSNSNTPTAAANWKVFDTGEIFTGDNSAYATGTGEYVSLKINQTNTNAAKTFHIAALNSISKSVVYITGTLNTNTTIGSYTISNVTVRVVDNVGNVGNWCRLSLDASGNPWIAYMDERYRGSRDGVKVAYLNATRFYKGGANSYNGQDTDLYGNSISGWEAMHVPTQYRVENAQLGLERFPTIRATGATRTGLASFAAVGFLGEDFYRIAYYIE